MGWRDNYDELGNFDDLIDTSGVISSGTSKPKTKNINGKKPVENEISKNVNAKNQVVNEMPKNANEKENVGDGVHNIPGDKTTVAEPPATEVGDTEQPIEQRTNRKEAMEVCAAAVIEFQGKECVVFNKGLMVHDADKEVKDRLHSAITNAFVDKKDIEYLHTLAQQCSFNGMDPFSSPQALQQMFMDALENGLIEPEEAPDLTKNILIGDKVYFKNGQVADLDEHAITFDMGQIEKILEAENPEQMKEMVQEIKESRPMDGPVQSGPVNDGPAVPSGGMER